MDEFDNDDFFSNDGDFTMIMDVLDEDIETLEREIEIQNHESRLASADDKPVICWVC